jgi:hypothetical protein
MSDTPSRPMTLTRDSIQIARLEEQMRQVRVDMAEARIQAERETALLKSSIEATKKQNEQILEKLAEARGGWKLLLALTGLVSACGGLVAYVASHIRFTP